MMFVIMMVNMIVKKMMTTMAQIIFAIALSDVLQQTRNDGFRKRPK